MKPTQEPRKPTEEEKNELVTWELEKNYNGDKAYADDAKGNVDAAYISVFDPFVTGGPGYAGKVMVVVWDSGAQHTESFEWYEGKIRYVAPDPELIIQRSEDGDTWDDIFTKAGEK